MRSRIVGDAWEPQVNGVVRTLQATIAELRAAGHEVAVISPDLFRSIPCPTYGEIRLAFAGWRTVGRHIRAFAPQAIHISTEGPLGLAARRWCLKTGRSEEHTSELQSLMRISYAVFCLKKKSTT